MMNDLRFLFRFESSPQYEGQYINSMYTLLKHQLHASSCFFLNIPSKCPLSNQHNLWKIKKFISAKAKGNTFGLKKKELNFCDENNTFYCLPTTYIDSVDHKLHLDSPFLHLSLLHLSRFPLLTFSQFNFIPLSLFRSLIIPSMILCSHD